MHGNDDGMEVTRVIFTKDGKEHVASRATSDDKKRVTDKLAAARKKVSGCECGEEFCDGEWLWRCMYAGGGECDWFITYIVC